MSSPTHMEHELVIPAPVERVWELTADIESWPSVSPTMTKVERLDDGPLGVGSQAKVTQPALGTRTWTVTTFEPLQEYVWEATLLGVTMSGGHHLSPEGDGCRNRLTLDLSGRGAGLMARLFGKRMLAAITAENEGFRSASTMP